LQINDLKSSNQHLREFIEQTKAPVGSAKY